MKSNTTIRAKISALGSGFPDNIVTNKDLEKFVDTSDQWISERTGIRERRRLLDGENNSDIGAKAALAALESAGKTAADIDLIIGCTNTPDRWMPSMAAMVQAKIGATEKCAAYDIVTACAGWLAGMQIANAFIRSGQYENILVVGSEALTRFVNWKDRGTCVLFGDGAGAALVTRASANEKSEIIDMRVRSDGRYGDILDMPGAGSRMPTTTSGSKIRITSFSPNAVARVERRISTSRPPSPPMRVLMRPSCGRRRSTTSMRPSSLMRLVMACMTPGGTW